MILVEGDTAYDTDFAMFYTLYHIFKQESIQGRGMIKGRHLALYQIFKATVFTTKYMINAVIRHIVIIRKYFVCISWIISRVNHDLAYIAYYCFDVHFSWF